MTTPVLAWLGTISYSLYLVHVPIGGKIVNLGARYAHTLPTELLVLAIAVVASLGVAWLLWYFVERPAQRWSSAITYPLREYAEAVRPTVIEPAL